MNGGQKKGKSARAQVVPPIRTELHQPPIPGSECGVYAEWVDGIQHLPKQQIGASYGEVFLAVVGVGLYTNLDSIGEWVKIKEGKQPGQDHISAYDFNYLIFRDLYIRNQELMPRLAGGQTGLLSHFLI